MSACVCVCVCPYLYSYTYTHIHFKGGVYTFTQISTLKHVNLREVFYAKKSNKKREKMKKRKKNK